LEALAQQLELEPWIDLVLILGDLTAYPRTLLADWSACLSIFSSRWPTAVIPGNHDVYPHAETGSSVELLTKHLPSITESLGVTWLHHGPYILGDTAIVGDIAWYDYSAKSPFLDHDDKWYARSKPHIVEDGAIDWVWSDPLFSKVCRQRIVKQLIKLENDEKIRRVIVGTHVPLFYNQMVHKPSDYHWEAGAAYFGNFETGKVVQEFSKVELVLSGHIHQPTECMVHDRLRAIVGPWRHNHPQALIIDLEKDLIDGAIEIVRT